MVFLDTSGLVSYVNARDEFHKQAQAVYCSLTETQITTDAVLTEVASFLSPVRLRWLAVEVKDSIEDARNLGIVEVVHADETLIERAWGLYRHRPDKGYSLVDCMSFLVMRDRDVTRAFTHDHHFEHEGFVCLIP